MLPQNPLAGISHSRYCSPYNPGEYPPQISEIKTFTSAEKWGWKVRSPKLCSRLEIKISFLCAKLPCAGSAHRAYPSAASGIIWFTIRRLALILKVKRKPAGFAISQSFQTSKSSKNAQNSGEHYAQSFTVIAFKIDEKIRKFEINFNFWFAITAGCCNSFFIYHRDQERMYEPRN